MTKLGIFGLLMSVATFSALGVADEAGRTLSERQMTSKSFQPIGQETRIYEVQREFQLQAEASGESVFFYEGEKILITRKTGDELAKIEFMPNEIDASYGAAIEAVEVNAVQIPEWSLTAQGSGDRETLARLTEQTLLGQKAEARARHSRRGGAYDQSQSDSSDPISDFFSGFGASPSGASAANGGRSNGRSYSRGGRMVLTDSRGRYQASGCLAFVESRVGWIGGHVGNGVGMVSALVNRMNWRRSGCSPVQGTVASWSGGRHGSGHTAVYNAARGCWEYDRGCTGLHMTGFSLIGCASR